MTKPVLAAAVVLFGLNVVAQAAVESGPKPEAAVAPLKVHAVVGEAAGTDVDFVELRKEKPTVYVFVPAKDFDRPMFRFMKQLEADLGADSKIVAVWMTDTADESKEYLPKISTYFTNSALTVFPTATGPDGWSINSAARCTVVAVNKGKVVKSFGYDSLNESDAKEVVDALKGALAK